MKLSLRAWWWIACLWLVSVAPAENFVIQNYRVNLDVQASGEVMVNERIEVVFTEPRRGIIRKIPVVYNTGDGVARAIRMDQISVTQADGQPWRTKRSREGEYLNIRVGDAKVYLDPGRTYVYDFKYRVRDVINWFDGRDWEPYAELYWNATGDEWDVEIQRAEVTVKFPTSSGGKGLRALVFTGAYGSGTKTTVPYGARQTEGEATGTQSSLRNDEFTVVRSTPLPPRNGLTFVLDLPANLIQQPSATERLWLLILSNIGFGIPFVVLALGVPLYYRFGRDPFTVRLQVRFEPPAGMTGSECGTLLDERVDPRDVSAGFFTLAVRGYLRFHPQTEGAIFQRKTTLVEMTGKPDAGDLPLYESQLLGILTRSGESMIDLTTLRSEVATSITSLRGHIFTSLIKRGYFRRSPEDVRTYWAVGLGLVVGLMGFIAFVLNPFGQALPSIVGAVIGLIIVAVFAPRMPRRTLAGAMAKEEVRAFEEFIRRGKDRTEWLAEKHPDAAMFEAYLPHAVAFGLLREWSQMFEGIVQETPSWYVTNQPGFGYLWFAGDVDAVSNSLAQAATVPPRSDGAGGGNSGFSSGGGFSGGGFGGGGGSSW